MRAEIARTSCSVPAISCKSQIFLAVRQGGEAKNIGEQRNYSAELGACRQFSSFDRQKRFSRAGTGRIQGRIWGLVWVPDLIARQQGQKISVFCIKSFNGRYLPSPPARSCAGRGDQAFFRRRRLPLAGCLRRGRHESKAADLVSVKHYGHIFPRHGFVEIRANITATS